MTNSIRARVAPFLLLLALAACGKAAAEDPKAMEARMVKYKDEVCACKTQRCAQDAMGKAQKVQAVYGKQVAGDRIPQSVLDNYLAMQECYRAANEGRQ